MKPDQQPRTGPLRDSSILAVGSLLSGLAAYAFIAIGTRTVGSESFASVSVLWTLWAMSAAVFTFPVQHWVIRTVEADSEGRVRSGLPSLLAASLVVSLILGMASWTLRESLFGHEGVVFPILAAIVPFGSVFMGLNRGVLSARLRFGSTATAIAGENLIRAGAALVATTAAGLGLALIAGFAIGFFWPSSLKLGQSGDGFEPSSPLPFLSGVAGGSLIGQIVLTSGPVVLALIGGRPSQVTGLFSALALFRAPYMIAIGVTPRVTSWLTRSVLSNGQKTIARLTARTIVSGIAASLMAAILGGAFGPKMLSLVFGSDVMLPGWTAAIVAAGSALAIFSLFLTLLMVAAARTGPITAAWAVAAMVGVLVLAIGVGSPVDTVAAAFLAAEIVALAAISVAALNPRRHRPAL